MLLLEELVVIFGTKKLPPNFKRRTKMKVFRIKASCDFIEEVEVIAETKEQAEELLFSGDYKVLNETYENQEIISIKENEDE